MLTKSIKILIYMFIFQLLGKRRPLFVTLELTNRCNSRCRYCLVRKKKGKGIPKEDAIDIIRELKALGTKKITITGGEPLLEKGIEDVIDFAKDSGMFISLVTNGSLISENVGLLRKIDLLIVSLDGREHANDKNRGIGSYRNAISAIDLAKNYGVDVIINCVITKHNINDVDFVMNLASKRGTGFTFNVLFGAKSPKVKKLLPTDRDYRAAIMKILKRKAEGYPIIVSYKTLLGFLRWDDYTKICKKSAGNRCFAGKFYCDIGVDGDLYPCLLYKFVKSFTSSGRGIKGKWFYIKERELPCNQCLFTCYNNWNDIISLDARRFFDIFKIFR